MNQAGYPPNGLLPTPHAQGYNKAPDGEIVDASWADAAGKIVSNLADMKLWAAALGGGTFLKPDTQAQRIGNGTAVAPALDYDFAISNAHGWLGHHGDIPGYATVVAYLPQEDATWCCSSTPMCPGCIRRGRSSIT